jgi:hypothetical protein
MLHHREMMLVFAIAIVIVLQHFQLLQPSLRLEATDSIVATKLALGGNGAGEAYVLEW